MHVVHSFPTLGHSCQDSFLRAQVRLLSKLTRCDGAEGLLSDSLRLREQLQSSRIYAPLVSLQQQGRGLQAQAGRRSRAKHCSPLRAPLPFTGVSSQQNEALLQGSLAKEYCEGKQLRRLNSGPQVRADLLLERLANQFEGSRYERWHHKQC